MNNNPTDIYGNLTWLNKQVQKLYCLIESLGGGGSITINPTNGVVPVRTSATTFGDSAIQSNEYNTRITHTFGAVLMNFLVSAEEGFLLQHFSYDFPENSRIELNYGYIGFTVATDDINAGININSDSLGIFAFQSGNYNSNINVDASSLYLNVQYINADNSDIKYWARQTISNNSIIRNVYTSNGGDFETSYLETILPGYLDVLFIQQGLDTQLRTTYIANSESPSIDTYLSNDGGGTILRTTYNGNINSPSINTIVAQGDGDILSRFLIQKDLIQLTVVDSGTNDYGCIFKMYVSGTSGKSRYNFSTVYTFASNAAALAGGLVAGDIYRHSGGALNIVF